MPQPARWWRYASRHPGGGFRRFQPPALRTPARALRLDKRGQKCELGTVSNRKLEQLRAALRAYGSCLVAYSGGVDSVFLARVAHEALGPRALAAIADSPSLPRRELQEALALAKQFQFPVRVVKTAEFDNPNYLSNPANRCYFCKHELFERLTPIARAEKFAVIAYGENASDNGDFRPGAHAAAEFQVRAPLKEAGLTKAEIRELSAQLGLPTADKPQMACLSSRVPYGEAVTPEKLAMIEAAENVLRDLGFHDVRVRHHEMRNAEGGARSEHNAPENSALRIPHSALALALARIELGPAEMPRFLAAGAMARVAEALKKIGYAHVTLDLQGYRRGSLNEKPGP
jgi:pyridinium-3,5-biscarboxylic acid mononucleotide sulfurtransferase